MTSYDLSAGSVFNARRLHSADYAVARCPSVCLFVCHTAHAGILTKRLYVSSNFFHRQMDHSSFPYDFWPPVPAFDALVSR